MRSMTDEPRLTYILIGINVLAGIGSLMGGGAGVGSSSLTDDGGLSQHFIAARIGGLSTRFCRVWTMRYLVEAPMRAP